MNRQTADDFRDSMEQALAAAAPHLIAAGRELVAAGAAFVAALNGESPTSEVIEVDES